MSSHRLNSDIQELANEVKENFLRRATLLMHSQQHPQDAVGGLRSTGHHPAGQGVGQVGSFNQILTAFFNTRLRWRVVRWQSWPKGLFQLCKIGLTQLPRREHGEKIADIGAVLATLLGSSYNLDLGDLFSLMW